MYIEIFQIFPTTRAAITKHKKGALLTEGSLFIYIFSADYCLKITIRFQSLCEGYS